MMTEETLFDLVLNSTPSERAALLDRECAGNPALRARIEALLAADEHPGSLLDPRPTPSDNATHSYGDGKLPTTASLSSPQDGQGTVLAGKYKLIEPIGEGGMGTVWLAQQSEPVKRKVAVKLIKRGMDSRQVIARFEAERQALAMMDHPNIAKVFDGGLTPDGRPFFVMELVKGTPITEYCDQRKLSPQQRLELFVPVCQAIQHAHMKGVIHRDIKPSNVLIALYDDKAVPKVIDFGVAKATGQQLSEHSINTGLGGVVGTPEYMSPEQATLNNLDIDTRSDVYSLGVLLYELLTGSTPVDRKSLGKAALLEILRIVREVEAPKPSAKLSTIDILPSVAANRGTEPAKLSKLMRGELDWVVLKALEKDRTRRYDTANGLARDIQRYLADEIVEARSPSVGYRLRKFVSRHKGQVIATSLVLFALVAGIAGTTVGLIRANRAAEAERIAKEDTEEQKGNALRSAERETDERQKADAAKVEAQAKEAEANAVVKFFEEQVFAAARPKGQAGGQGAGVTLRDAIAASVPAIEKGFAEQPLVEARLRHALGKTFQYLAEYEQARAQNERARALLARHRGPEHLDTLRSMHNMANSYDDLNRPADALKLREETLAIMKRVLPQDHPNSLMSMMTLAGSYAALNRPADALKLQEETLAIQKRVLPQDHPDTLMSMNNLALSYAALNRPANALKLREETLAIMKRVLPKDHQHTLTSMHNLAGSYAALNRPADALKLREETLAIQKRVLPQNHPDTLASMNNLAASYEALNRHADALKLREEVLAIRKRVLLKDHPDMLTSMYNLALSYAALNRPADALKLHEETLAIQKRVLPKDHPDTLRSMHNMANSYYALNRPADALKLREEVLAIRKRVLPPDHPDTLLSMNNLAVSYATLNRPADALKLQEETLAIQKRVLPKDHPDTLGSMYNLASSLIQLDRGIEAIPLLDEFLAKARTSPAMNSRLIPRALSLRAEHFQKTGDPAGCRATAEMWEQLNRADAVSLYDAACFRAVAAGVQAKAPGADSAKLAQDDADRAMQFLHKAVQAGYKDAAHMKQDTDLDPLRDRDDFKKLLAELEQKFPPPKKPDPPQPTKKE